ncbi:hypothetical protein INR49_014688 [Caranx melampygus]|nr:hypothetical protein INR49_014688 [Caranx melampygus]
MVGGERGRGRESERGGVGGGKEGGRGGVKSRQCTDSMYHRGAAWVFTSQISPRSESKWGKCLVQMLLALFLLSLRLGLIGSISSPVLTFEQTDPLTGAKLECDRCPPGTYLRSRCTATQRSDCAPCPQGSFTELWNHIEKCLRCGVCGTVNEDTVCHICPNGTFSDVESAQLNCTEHRSCPAGQQLLLRGSIWHDSMCVSCTDQGSKDGASYLRELIPAFFRHHKINIKRLRRIAHNLPTEDGRRHGGTSTLSLSEVTVLINTWVSTATLDQIRQLPAVLMKVGANNTGERLQNKLHRLDSSLTELCGSGHNGVLVIIPASLLPNAKLATDVSPRSEAKAVE